ncbi:MAG TPA: flagellar biosynthetic protein FliO [Candidatus Babeliales bacterium]|nr:flagellar biosynthetic protein FliO [Candidatus Babeliales bacterium]
MPWSFWAGYLEKLALVAFMLAATYFAARKLRDTRLFARGGRCLVVLESAMLSPHCALHLVRAGSRYFLVGSAAGALSALAELTPADARPNHTLK